MKGCWVKIKVFIEMDGVHWGCEVDSLGDVNIVVDGYAFFCDDLLIQVSISNISITSLSL